MANPANPLNLPAEAFQEALNALPMTTMTGGCHCGTVRFKVSHPALEAQGKYQVQVPISNCNCSICEKNGYLSIYPGRESIEWLSGWDEMRNYRFGTKNRDHKFCGTCGSSVCIDFLGNWHVGDVIGLNVSFLNATVGLDMWLISLRQLGPDDRWG